MKSPAGSEIYKLDGGKKSVQVTDKDWKFLYPTRPAKARKLIKGDRAELIDENPPMIRLNRTIDLQKGGNKMEIKSVNEYFESESEVYIQNVFGGVVSLSFKDRDDVIPFTLPNVRVPIRLTDYIEKDLIKKSSDFRRFLMRKPPAIRLLTEEEYYKIVGRVAKETGKDESDVISDIAGRVNMFQNRAEKIVPEREPFNPETSDDSRKDRFDSVDVPGIIDDGMNPRVLQIVSNCAVDAENRISADAAMQELILLDLDDESLNYVLGACAYSTVRKWAQMRLNENLITDDSDDSDDKLSPAHVEGGKEA